MTHNGNPIASTRVSAGAVMAVVGRGYRWSVKPTL
jgi:hypothetical protein